MHIEWGRTDALPGPTDRCLGVGPVDPVETHLCKSTGLPTEMAQDMVNSVQVQNEVNAAASQAADAGGSVLGSSTGH